MSTIIWNLLNLFACIPLLMTLINLMTWTRGKLADAAQHRLSVLIPVHNEQETLDACISAIDGSDVTVGEMIAYNDPSIDRTPQILSNLSHRYTDTALKIITRNELPQGWVGKSHACHHMAVSEEPEYERLLAPHHASGDTTKGPRVLPMLIRGPKTEVVLKVLTKHGFRS